MKFSHAGSIKVNVPGNCFWYPNEEETEYPLESVDEEINNDENELIRQLHAFNIKSKSKSIKKYRKAESLESDSN